MFSTWESIVIALSLILGYYYVRQLRRHQKTARIKTSSAKYTADKEKTMKAAARTRNQGAAVPMLSHYIDRRKKEITPKHVTRPAALLLHPHTLEQAKIEYCASASLFQGLYEPLYQASLGNIHDAAFDNLLLTWESRMKTTPLQYLELVWQSSMRQASSRSADASENTFLEVWFRYLKNWGLQRSLEAGQVTWSMNGRILEQMTQEHEKSS